MDASSKVRRVRAALLALVVGSLVLVVFGIFVGLGLPGIIFTLAGWALVISAIVWLVVLWTQHSAATTRGGSWRPGDGDAAR